MADRQLLETAVQRCWPGATVDAAHPLPADASTRRYVRLELSGAAAPPSCIAMLLPSGEAGRVCEEIAGAATVAELPFVNVQRFLRERGVPVPEIWFVDENAGILLEEDLGAVPLADALLEAPETRPTRLCEAADLLAGFASLAATPEPACFAFHDRYDSSLITRELAVTSAYGLAPSFSGPPRVAGADPELDRLLAGLGERIAAQPVVLMHRDYHAWNLHLDPAGRLRLLDFQDALLGPALYDLASLASDRDSDRFIGPAEETTLLDAWTAGLRRRGFDLAQPHHEIERQFHEAIAYRTLRVIGRFGFLAIERGKPGYLDFVPRMARRCRRALEQADHRALAAALAARSPAFA